MKFLKGFVCLLLCVSLLTACVGTDNVQNNSKLNIVTTIFPVFDFVRNVVGDNAQVSLLIAPGSEVHTFEPTPKQMIEIENADLFFYIGGESEAWVNNVLVSTNRKTDTNIALINSVETLDAEHNHEHGEHDEHDVAIDEHIWTSPKNAVKMVDDIKNAVCAIDAENSSDYNALALDYKDKLEQLHNEFTEVVNGARIKTLVFGDRFPFAYFAKEYSLDFLAAYPGCYNNTEPSAAAVANLIEQVRRESIPVVFYIEFSNRKVADTICSETGATALEFHSCHNVSKTDFDSGIGYIELMQANKQNLITALK